MGGDASDQPFHRAVGRRKRLNDRYSSVCSAFTRGDRCRSSSINFDASAFVRSGGTVSPVSVASVSRYERWDGVIGSSPVFQSSGFFWSPGSAFVVIPQEGSKSPTVP